MLIGILICWAMFVLVVFNIDPTNGGAALFLFYTSLGMALIGSLSIFGTLIRIFLLKKQIIFREVKNSLRQAFLFSFLLVVIMILQSKRILAWWNIIFLIIALASLEGLLVSIKN